MEAAIKLWMKLAGCLRDYVHRHWRQVLLLRQRLRLSEEAFHLLLAGCVGLIGGLVHLLYHALSHFIQWLAYSGSGTILQVARQAEPLRRLVVVEAGALVAGLVLYFGLRLVGSRGQSSLLEVVVAGDGRLPLRPALVKAASSAVSISTGASIGREGLIVQLVATISSALGQLAQWPPYRLRLLVACGAAAGLAAAFDAPIAGAVFAAQIVLGNFSMRLFAPLVFASVIAAMVSRRFFGLEQWYVVPSFDFTRLGQLPWFVVLGVLAGVAGAVFFKLMNRAETWFARVRTPIYINLTLAGVAVGALAMMFPEVLGNGYEATSEMLGREAAPDRLLGFFVVKMAATVICIGAGTVGGVFTPTLFLGAALGCAMGAGLHSAGFATPLPVGAFGLVGMGAMLAATTQSPLLAIIMIFELSLNYSLMPALMPACVVATLVTRGLGMESVYTEPLRKRGLRVDRDGTRLGEALELTVGDLMRAPVPPVRNTAPFREVAEHFLNTTYNNLPVVDERQRLLGVVALHDLKEHLNAGPEFGAVIADDLMRPPPPCLTPDQKLSDALPVLLTSELRNVPVVNNRQELKLIGAVSRVEALGLCSELISSTRPST